MSTNIVILEGNLGRDSETRYFQSGSKVVTFPLGVSRRYKGNDGAEHEETAWADVKCYGRTADDAAGLAKGARCLVIGELRQENWIDKQTNQPRSKLVVSASTVSAIQRMQQPQQAQGFATAPMGYPTQGRQQMQPQPGGYGQAGGYMPAHPVDEGDIPVAGTDNTPF